MIFPFDWGLSTIRRLTIKRKIIIIHWCHRQCDQTGIDRVLKQDFMELFHHRSKAAIAGFVAFVLWIIVSVRLNEDTTNVVQLFKSLKLIWNQMQNFMLEVTVGLVVFPKWIAYIYSSSSLQNLTLWWTQTKEEANKRGFLSICEKSWLPFHAKFLALLPV